MVSVTISVLGKVLVRKQDIGNTASHGLAGQRHLTRGRASVGLVDYRWIRKRAAMRDSADAQPASKGWPGLSRSMTTGA